MRISLVLSPEKLPEGISEIFVRSVVRASATRAFPTLFADPKRGVSLEVALVTDRAITTLNAKYRGYSKPTDVLSFGNYSSRQSIQKARTPILDLGTIVLSLPFIRRMAKQDGVSWEREFTFVLSHGVLHLLGFDHEERMFTIQDRVTDHFFPLV